MRPSDATSTMGRNFAIIANGFLDYNMGIIKGPDLG